MIGIVIFKTYKSKRKEEGIKKLTDKMSENTGRFFPERKNRV